MRSLSSSSCHCACSKTDRCFPVHNDFQNPNGIFPLFDGLEARDDDLPVTPSSSPVNGDEPKTNGHTNGHGNGHHSPDPNAAKKAERNGTAAATEPPAGAAPPY